MARSHAHDHETQCSNTGITNLKLVDIPPAQDDNLTLLCDVSQSDARPVVTESFRREVFNLIHNLAHPGAWSTCKPVRARFVWKGLNRDVRRWTPTCISCQQSKSSDTQGPHSTSSTISDLRFDDIHVDIIVPLPQSHAFCYLFTCIDRYTRWIEAIPMTNMSMKTCARALLDMLGLFHMLGQCSFRYHRWQQVLLVRQTYQVCSHTGVDSYRDRYPRRENIDLDAWGENKR